MRPTRVLIIEDDRAVQETIRTVLESEGYEVLTSECIVDPTDVAQLRPNLVLLDLRLRTSTDGWDFLQTLKQTPAARRIPVVVCTGDNALVNQQKVGFDELAAGVILKPFDVNDLLARVEAAAYPVTPDTRTVVTAIA